jgi:hypothetical protein
MKLNLCIGQTLPIIWAKWLIRLEFIKHFGDPKKDKAGIYKALWRPEEIGAKYAKDIIEIVEKGLADLKARPKYFEQFNNPNGWGMYEHFVPFVAKYLEALKEYPEAKIEVSR